MNRTAHKRPNLMIQRMLLISMMALFLGNYSIAQEQLSRKQQADVLFNRFEYFNAAKLYLPIAERKNPDVKVVEKLADCYRMMNDYEQAEKWYGKAVADKKAKPMSHYYYAEALQRNKKFDLAKDQYRAYGSLIKPEEMNIKPSSADQYLPNESRPVRPEEIAIRIASCDTAALWTSQPKNVLIKNMASLNTKSADWGLNYYGKEGFVFTSERSTETNSKGNDIYKWTGNPWLKLYLASADGQPKAELPVVTKENMPSQADYHVGPMELNGTGDVAYVTIATRASKSDLPLDKTGKIKERLYTRRLELMTAVKKDGKWGELKPFLYNDVKAYSLGHAALSKNGQVLYFASDMPGGLGKTDIWYTELQADGSWGKPQNCGSEINTTEEEAFPTIGPTGELYYSSKGKIGMGGYDIYRSQGEKGQWSKTQNLKYPLNSTSDDFYLVSNDDKEGYFSSNREGGAGDDDIYAFNNPPAPVVVPEKPVVVVPVIPVVPVDKPQKGQRFVIYYDFDRSKIRTDAVPVLDSLAVLMDKYPELQVALSSFTDSRGKDAYNLILSEKRAKSAIAYLIKKGIASDRITGKGYGETQLLNNCGNGIKCTEAKHQLNRRTEAVIVN